MTYEEQVEANQATFAKYDAKVAARAAAKQSESAPPPEVVQTAVKAAKPPRRFSTFKTINLYALAASVLFIVIGLATHHTALFEPANWNDPAILDNYQSQVGPFTTWAKGLGVIVVYWVLAYTFWYLRLAHRTTQAVLKDIPTLQEIDWQLRQEGYNPTIQDCVAIEQHLKSERNENAVLLGAILIGPQLLNAQAKGKL